MNVLCSSRDSFISVTCFFGKIMKVKQLKPFSWLSLNNEKTLNFNKERTRRAPTVRTLLDYCSLETPKMVIDKLCRPRSDASDQGLPCLQIVQLLFYLEISKSHCLIYLYNFKRN